MIVSLLMQGLKCNSFYYCHLGKRCLGTHKMQKVWFFSITIYTMLSKTLTRVFRNVWDVFCELSGFLALLFSHMDLSQTVFLVLFKQLNVFFGDSFGKWRQRHCRKKNITSVSYCLYLHHLRTKLNLLDCIVKELISINI